MTPISSGSALPPPVLEAFSASLVTALQEMAQLTAIPLAASGSAPEPGEVLAAEMRLERRPPGRVRLVLPPFAARRLAEAYLPAGTVLTAELRGDVACEFVNVIAGQAKTMLKDTPYHFVLTIPQVVPLAPGGEPGGTRLMFALESGSVALDIDFGT